VSGKGGKGKIAALTTVGVAGLLGGLGMWASRSPVPSAATIRFLFDAGGRSRQRVLRAFALDQGVDTHADVPYLPGNPDCVMDVFVPSAALISDDSPAPSATSPTASGAARGLPVLVWMHGGAWLAGVKDDNTEYLKLMAARGMVVVSINYSLSPKATYPTAITQVLSAIGYVHDNAAAFGADPDAIFVGGDSAGAQLAAQAALTITDPEYARMAGLVAPITAKSLLGQVLYCGSFDFSPAGVSAPLQAFFRTVFWSYTGNRDVEATDAYRHGNIARHVSASVPPAFISSGNADFLEQQSRTLAARLEEEGVPCEAMFYPKNHTPRLVHEFQFDLRLNDALAVFEGAVRFVLSRYEQARA